MGVIIPAALALTMAVSLVGGVGLVLDHESLVPMGVFVGGILLVSGVVWQAGRKFQLMLSRIERLEDDVIELKDWLSGRMRPRRPNHTEPNHDYRRDN
jgi:hypothetical protein